MPSETVSSDPVSVQPRIAEDVFIPFPGVFREVPEPRTETAATAPCWATLYIISLIEQDIEGYNMDANDYLAMLDRAKEQLPETIETHERFELPELDIIQEGKITVFKNFIDVTDKIRRDPQHLLQYLLKELRTPGTLENRRVVFKAKINPSHIDEKIRDYTETYVICSECGRPDTHIDKEDRTFILVCEACGARRPIMIRKAARPEDANTLHVGDVVEVTINDVGKKGDGVAKYLDYLIVVPGTTRGTRANVKITNISAKTAFGQVTSEAVNH